jgi:hypothetical protein
VILFAWTLTRMPPRIARIVAFTLGAIMFAAMPAYYTYTGFPRAPFSELANSLRVHLEPNDVVVHDNKLSVFPSHYYAPALPHSLPTQQALGLYATTLAAATTNKARVYFIIFQNAIDQAAEEGRAHPNLAWLEQRYRRISVDAAGDLRVYRYETR